LRELDFAQAWIARHISDASAVSYGNQVPAAHQLRTCSDPLCVRPLSPNAQVIGMLRRLESPGGGVDTVTLLEEALDGLSRRQEKFPGYDSLW
jgi:hypothetical protein